VIRRLLIACAAPVVAVTAFRPVVDRLARRLMAAPRTTPDEAGLRPALEALGGEIVRLRSRDGVRLMARWLVAAGADDLSAADGDVADRWVPDPHEAILLLHGWSGSIAPDLVELAPFLCRTASVLGLDFRGHGASDDGPTTFGVLEIEDVAGAITWLGERGVTRVALVGSSMGGVTALAAVAVLGDGRLAAADADPDAPAASIEAPRPRIVAVVADAVTPELSLVVGRQARIPFGRRLAERAFGRMGRIVGGDPRDTQPIRSVTLIEDVPLLLIHGDADPLVPIRDANRLAAAAPPGTRHLVIAGAGHAAGHAVDPATYEATVTGHLRGAFEEARPRD
jgi:pimeloyl-ACP methyl ester carboxylesterase